MHTLIFVKYSTKLTFWLYFMKNEFDSPFAMNVLVKKLLQKQVTVSYFGRNLILPGRFKPRFKLLMAETEVSSIPGKYRVFVLSRKFQNVFLEVSCSLCRHYEIQ